MGNKMLVSLTKSKKSLVLRDFSAHSPRLTGFVCVPTSLILKKGGLTIRITKDQRKEVRQKAGKKKFNYKHRGIGKTTTKTTTPNDDPTIVNSTGKWSRLEKTLSAKRRESVWRLSPA
ncbi:hypothetical protein KQX54_019301 [Cotesia glomerata]|uniref:Uncharacterized protein n=1 Tax=Cotesia glomerata TaxID=32391 RepID=A0AAV7J2Y8_COTGL|nr:hypothetical protein KQX54_019301 [Cotesia glomerata]